MAEKKPAASNESPPMTKALRNPFVETVKKISQLALRQLQEGNIEESLEKYRQIVEKLENYQKPSTE